MSHRDDVPSGEGPALDGATLDHEEQAALAAFRGAASLPRPTVFHTARAAHRLEAALDADARARWPSGRVALVAAVAGCAGAAVVALALSLPAAPRAGRGAAIAERVEEQGGEGAATTTWAELDGTSWDAPHASRPAVAPSPAALPARAPATARDAAFPPEPARTVAAVDDGIVEQRDELPEAAMGIDDVVPPSPAPREALGWREDVRRLVDMGEVDEAVRVLLRAMPDDAAAGSTLALLGRRFPAALEAVDDQLALFTDPEAMRLRCEQHLLRARDRAAVQACRAFGQTHPQHPAARMLSFAAGRAAEGIGELRWAEEEYSRSLLLSPFSGLPGTDALLARARVRAALGDVDEARADLRLYLHSEPAGRADPAVARLALELDVE